MPVLLLVLAAFLMPLLPCYPHVLLPFRSVHALGLLWPVLLPASFALPSVCSLLLLLPQPLHVPGLPRAFSGLHHRAPGELAAAHGGWR